MPDALEHLIAEEQGKLVDMESVSRTAVQRVEQTGIIFVDEIDKIASRDGSRGGGHGPDVSREGVQRDILPIVEGTTVNTKHGMVKTDHILFIAAGAFHVSKPSDLIPELQGRFPIRVELEPLTRDDFVRILTEPRNALVKQYTALLGTEDLTLTFTPTPSSGSPTSRRGSTTRPRTSAPAACTRSWNGCSTSCRSKRRIWRTSRSRSTRPTSSACSPTSSRTRIFRATSCDRSWIGRGRQLPPPSQIAQHPVARFHCGSAVVGRSRDLASVQESDSLVLTREGVSIDHAGCVGDFDGVPQFVADEGDLHICRRQTCDANVYVADTAGRGHERQATVRRSVIAAAAFEIHDHV